MVATLNWYVFFLLEILLSERGKGFFYWLHAQKVKQGKLLWIDKGTYMYLLYLVEPYLVNQALT